MIEIKAQDGYQKKFLSSSADIVIGGAGAGVGKTYSLLLESTRHIDNPGFGATCFRRTSPQITSEGGLWDESVKLYTVMRARQQQVARTWTFPSGAKISFSHMQHEKNKYDWQGSQIPLIMFDELTHFTKGQFLYMLSRNRSMCGVKPYIRATCNPDPDSFVAEMIDWAIDDQGYIIPEMNNKIRYFTVYEDMFIWGDAKSEVIDKSPHIAKTEDSEVLIKSFAFIEGDIYDNKILLDKDPGYIANLEALPEDEKLRLLKRNWKVKVDGNVIVDYNMFQNVFSNTHVTGAKRYITADIATEGKDCLIIWVFEGKKVIDIQIIDKNNGKEALEAIEAKKRKYNVPASNVSFDASGVGGGLTGFISNAREFKSSTKPIGKDGYKNLKSQCAYEFSYCVNQTHQKTEKDSYYIPEYIYNKKYPFNTPSLYKDKTIKWILNHQLKVLRKKEIEGKKGLIDKKEMKAILGNISGDFIESLIQREVFDLEPKRFAFYN